MTSKAWKFGPGISHSDAGQPPLLAFVASLWDEREKMEAMKFIVQLPDGERISEEQFRYDAIGESMMDEWGVPLPEMVDAIMPMLEQADFISAYAVEHHGFLLRRAIEDCGMEAPIKATHCLMKKSTIPCRIPTRTVGTYKQPKMIEAYLHFAGKPFELPAAGSADAILSYHLNAREVIYLGIKAWDDANLKKAASGPIKPTW